MNIPQTLVSYASYLPEPAPFSFFLRPTTLLEIKTIYSNLKLTALGFDDINLKVTKPCSTEISLFLLYMIKRSFNEGCFPEHLQIARVTPIHEKKKKR